jgi:hypothetical protein
LCFVRSKDKTTHIKEVATTRKEDESRKKKDDDEKGGKS